MFTYRLWSRIDEFADQPNIAFRYRVLQENKIEIYACVNFLLYVSKF